MSEFWATLALGVTLGLFAGCELARRAYKDVAGRLAETNRILDRALANADYSEGRKPHQPTPGVYEATHRRVAGMGEG